MDNNQPGQLATPDQIVIDQPPLALPISESVILQTLDFAEQRGRSVRQQMRIDERTKTNVDFWKGNQVDASKLDARFQEMHVDNVVRQDLENKIKLATGNMPNIFAAPPDRQGFNVDAANDIQAHLRDRLGSGTNKRLLKNGLRKLDLEFIAVIKPRYDAKYQRSLYELIDSSNILFGEGSKIYEDGFTIDGTHILFHYVEEETQQVLNRFPKKADELMRALSAGGKEIPSRITYTEAQFDWYDQEGNCNQGVACRYGTVVLDAFKQPYYNYDNKQVNYFDRPRKNYILFSYANLGDSGVYESTTDFEQGIPINRIINRRRRQITEISDRAVPKLAFMGGAMTKPLAESMSNNPSESIILSDNYAGNDIRGAMQVIPATPPNTILYNDMLDLRGRIDSLFATHGQTRGENNAPGESGVSKQITREGDLVTSDDIGDITVERVIYEMACWEMQFLRLFQDDDRPPLRITNSEGETEYIELNRKKIETDIQIVVKASSQNEQRRRADALQLLTAKAIDPYTLLEDLGVSNPRERMRRMMAFIQAQQSGNFATYMETIGVDPKTPFATADDAKRDIDILRTGHTVQLRLPSEAYVAAFQALKNSPEFTDPTQAAQAGWNEYNKQLIDNHISRMRMLVDEEAKKQQAQDGVAAPPGMPGAPPAGMPETAMAFQPPAGQSLSGMADDVLQQRMAQA